MKWVARVVVVGFVASATVASAEVNCALVNKYLKAGRSVQDIVETMVIEESEVKKCQEQASETGGTQGSGGVPAAPSSEEKSGQ
jgi:hypothetical protein